MVILTLHLVCQPWSELAALKPHKAGAFLLVTTCAAFPLQPRTEGEA